ncbi:tripartite motif-containing protein 2 [Lingula anatina]|uniref:Tripartite motif-containing protein 2 n=1 Tax=Lingula anatina TaxID=7574 RepID=A0A1S3KBG1_LINAN|nr:tripartite motif-containing protein 2 [Lingula anatina]|eukprot:XP_013419779.1 tripartite motif-containing protein 2 [Lingula anatina]
MVDFLSKYRMYGYGFTQTDLRTASSSYKDLYRNSAPHVFKAERALVHDCREPVVKAYTDSKLWEAYLLTRGLSDTARSQRELNAKEKEEEGMKKFFRPYSWRPQKLLFNVGVRGRGKGEFSYPRGLTITDDRDIVIADTMNHRIQIFNNFGVFKSSFRSLGSGEGQFNEPTGVSVFPNQTIAVADKKNKRIQVLTLEGRFKYSFPTVDEPYSVACDIYYNTVVGTASRTVEVYRRGGKLLSRFEVGGKPPKTSMSGSPIHVAVNNKNEVVLCDSVNCRVRTYSYAGDLLYQFRTEANGDGLAAVPAGVCLNPLGQILIADRLNHTVNVYSERGQLLLQIVGPPDLTGSVQTCAIGPEGHLVVTEYSTNGDHCFKIFRYRDCECHRYRPGSSRRSTPTPKW